MSNILVTGSSNGLGKELATILELFGHDVIRFDIEDGRDVRKADSEMIRKLLHNSLSLESPQQHLDVLINCAGVNLINWLEKVTDADWDAVMDINAKGIYKMSQACLPFLIESKGTIVNIVSNAAHMPMTCSLAYNASKGAAHIMTLQLARELTKKYGITVFGVAPNKLAGTNMSESIDEQVVHTRGWTKEYAHEYQVNAMLAQEETPPELVAHFIAYLLTEKRYHKYLTGCVIPYGA